MNATLIAELLAEHRKTKTTLERAKDKERKLRDKIVSLVFPNAKKGTNKTSLKESGLEIKAVITETWSVKQDGLDELLTDNEELQRAFKYKYDFVKAGYESLDDEQKTLLADQVTCKANAPTLTYEGELSESHLNEIKADCGVLLLNGQVVSVTVADAIARRYGFQHAEELVTFLEEIQ